MLVLGLLLSAALAEEKPVTYNILFSDLMNAYSDPSAENLAKADSDAAVLNDDLALSLVESWKTVWLDPEYRLYLNGQDDPSLLPVTGKHAFIVLGYQLSNGEMTEELIGRCDAAVAAARAFPDSILVCSGGATGENNPQRHTEAGEMRKYLVKNCGIDKSRIFIDEKARDTVENAVNTFEILREQGIRTITIVTSSYHQKWGQAIYNAMNALYRQRFDYSVEIVENYCYEKKPKDSFKKDDRWAASQLAAVLNLPGKLTKSLPRP